MSEQHKKNEKNFLIQGSILAIAGVITKLIGAFYRFRCLILSERKETDTIRLHFQFIQLH